MNKLAVNSDKDGFNTLHPALVLLQEGKTISKWKVVDDFEDDHLPCVTIELTVDKQKFLIDDCWLTMRGCSDRIRAEKDKTVRDGIVKSWMSSWKRAARENAAWKKEMEADIAALANFELKPGDKVRVKNPGSYSFVWEKKPVQIIRVNRKKGTVTVGTAKGDVRLDVSGARAMENIRKVKPPLNRIVRPKWA